MMKRLFRSPPVQFVLALVLASYMRLVKHTTQWRVEGEDIVQAIWDGGEGVIGTLWHSRVLMTIAGWPLEKEPAKQFPAILISLSPDGEFVAKATKMLGVGVIRGSTGNPKKKQKNKGGLRAFRDMLKHVQGGNCLAITPDGPRGPRQRVSLGAIQLAAKTGAPVLAFAWSTEKAKFLKSWDRFLLPLPFGKGVIVWDGPLHIARNAGPDALEAARRELEDKLNAATERADRACGHEPIRPEPLRPEPLRSEGAA